MRDPVARRDCALYGLFGERHVEQAHSRDHIPLGAAGNLESQQPRGPTPSRHSTHSAIAPGRTTSERKQFVVEPTSTVTSRRPVLRPAGRRRASTTRPTRRTPAASRSSPTSTAGPSHAIVAQALTALHNLDHRGRGRRRAVLRRRRRHHRRSARRVPARGRRLRAAGRRRLRRRQRLPAGRRRAGRRRRARWSSTAAADEGLHRARLARRADRQPPASARRRCSVMPRFEQVFVAGAARRARPGARAARLLRPQGRRAAGPRGRPRAVLLRRCRRAPSSTRACSPPTSSARSSPT